MVKDVRTFHLSRDLTDGEATTGKQEKDGTSLPIGKIRKKLSMHLDSVMSGQ
jgi:hypothetical protein